MEREWARMIGNGLGEPGGAEAQGAACLVFSENVGTRGSVLECVREAQRHAALERRTGERTASGDESESR